MGANNISYEFDFAFSFAGEDRKIVEKVKKILEKNNLSVFYDNDLKHKLIGKDLYSYLRDIYRYKGKFVVCFISKHYSKKIWTNLEFTAVKERLMSTFFASDFLLPIIIDKQEKFKDIPSYIGFYIYESPEKVAKLLINKYNSSLIEDNYLYNIENCINYICEKLCEKFNKLGIKFTYKNNKINISNSNVCIMFSTDKTLNSPCILVYINCLKVPVMIITWNSLENLSFNIHNFKNIELTQQKISLTDTIEYLFKHLMENINV